LSSVPFIYGAYVESAYPPLRWTADRGKYVTLYVDGKKI